MKTLLPFLIAALCGIHAVVAASPTAAPTFTLILEDQNAMCTCVAAVLDPDQDSYPGVPPNGPSVGITWTSEKTDGACAKPCGERKCSITFRFTLDVQLHAGFGVRISGHSSPSGTIVAGASRSWSDTIEAECMLRRNQDESYQRLVYTLTTGSDAPLFTFNPGVKCNACGHGEDG